MSICHCNFSERKKITGSLWSRSLGLLTQNCAGVTVLEVFLYCFHQNLGAAAEAALNHSSSVLFSLLYSSAVLLGVLEVHREIQANSFDCNSISTISSCMQICFVLKCRSVSLHWEETISLLRTLQTGLFASEQKI